MGIKLHIRTFTLLFIISITSTLHAQIENEIVSFVDSSELIVTRGRQLMLDRLMEKDYDKASRIQTLILSKTEHKECAPFTYNEAFNANLLLRNWERCEALILDLEDYPSAICYKTNDNFDDVVFESVQKNLDALHIDLKQTDISTELKEVLNAYLILIEEGVKSEEYASCIKALKIQYPESTYPYFTKNYLPSIPIKAALSYTLGAIQTAPLGTLANSFTNSTNFAMSMDINIDKVYSSLYMHGGALKINNSFSDGTNTFYPNEHFSYIEGGIKLGYFLLRNKRFHIAPFGTIGGTELKSNLYAAEEQLEGEELKIINSFTTGIGLHTEIKLHEFMAKGAAWGYGYAYNPTPTNQYFSLKVDIGYNLPVSQKNDYFRGNIFYYGLSIVWGIGDF